MSHLGEPLINRVAMWKQLNLNQCLLGRATNVLGKEALRPET
jgi:hypothetical protein